MNCSICQNEIQAVGDWTQGNNAEPVNDGRCCDDCNATVVIPARLTQMRRRMAKTHTPGPWRFQRDAASDGDAPYWMVNFPTVDGSYGSANAMVYTTEEDARLVTAAPELLAALKLLVLEAQAIGWDCSHITPVIKKAEGRGE